MFAGVFLSLFMFMFMIIPVAIPVTIAAYSIVGEKTTHSLEPLLATPITTSELLVGQSPCRHDAGDSCYLGQLHYLPDRDAPPGERCGIQPDS